MCTSAELIAIEAPGHEGVLESAQVIRSEAHRLARLIDDLLLLDRIDATELKISRTPMDLNAVVADTVARLRALDVTRDVHLALERHLPPVPADAERIAQVVTNLVGNAVRYSPDGEPVTVQTKLLPVGVEIRVVDRGFGIPPEDQENIFQRYQRGRSGLARGVSGTGLSFPSCARSWACTAAPSGRRVRKAQVPPFACDYHSRPQDQKSQSQWTVAHEPHEYESNDRRPHHR
ncbi:MAG: ATP-binding protein, partial [Chloroflexota bacterium]|nr:ATP-binding protein [Chloroflexota bacterium]